MNKREVRAVIARMPTRPDPSAEGGKVIDFTLPSPSGIAVPVEPDVLVAEARVSPEAPSWFGDLVRDVTARYGFDFLVRQSELFGDPLY